MRYLRHRRPLYQEKLPGEPAPIPYDAFRLAQAGRPGPTLVDIPRDVQQEEDVVVTTGVGQHQMRAAQYPFLRPAQRLHFLGRSGGDGLRAPFRHRGQVGAASRARLEHRRDGGFQMTMQELATVPT